LAGWATALVRFPLESNPYAVRVEGAEPLQATDVVADQQSWFLLSYDWYVVEPFLVRLPASSYAYG